jgi:DNA polymerase-1
MLESQFSLFSQPASLSLDVKGWKPDPLPVLDSRFKVIALDPESTGSDKWSDLPCGYGLSLEDGRDFYIPCRHRAGGNYDPDTVRRWAQTELRDKIIVNINTGGDSEWMYNDGIDLEAQGNQLIDIAHNAALLNEYRYSGFGLNALGHEFVGRGKSHCPVAPRDIWKAHASHIADYAKSDSRLALDVYHEQLPQIKAQGLEEVAQLESDLIYVVNEMERNGSPIDLIKLERWRKELREEIQMRTLRIYEMCGVRVNPNSSDDMRRLFARLGLPFTDIQADTLKTIAHPVIKEAFRVKQILSLLSKYFDKFWKLSRETGIVRYTLHQLRADEGGTVTGRFSSSGGKEQYGINCQQVMKPEKQRLKMKSSDYIVRELFIPAEGEWFSADAKQIEFRLFGHYANNSMMIDAYKKDPNTDFYTYVKIMLKQVANYEISRENSKVLNLATIYGQGKEKREKGLGVDTRTREVIDEAYNTAFPEAARLLRKAAELGENRGFVKTYLGRRGRFDEEHDRYYSALNKVLQGTAADIMKKKLLRLYRMRKELEITLRMTVHDEADGDLRNPDKKDMLREVLDYQEIPTRVPILWDTGFGPNWAGAK